jgi:hypothetical protein
LVVTILALLLSKVWPKWNFQLDYKKPEYYLLGVVVSMLIVFVFYNPLSRSLYHVLWKVDVPPRDLMAAFSLEDIINIWVIAVALALLPWTIVGGFVRLWAALNVRIQKDKTPTPQDQPLDVLLRLQRAHEPFNLKQAAVAGQRLWELPVPAPDPAKKWVSGRVCVIFPAPNTLPSDQARQEVADAAARFQNLLNQPAQTPDLYDLLHRQRNRITIRWQPPDQSPQLLDKKDSPTVTGATDDFVYAG